MSHQLPRYSQIIAEIQDRISRGEWKAGDALPNRTLLCKEFGTTRVTLDKAIHQLVQGGALTSAKGSGTFVAHGDAHGRIQRSASQSLRVGVVIGNHIPVGEGSDVDDVYFGPLMRGIIEGLSDRDVQTSYAQLPASGIPALFRDGDLDGLLVVTPRVADIEVLRSLHHQGVSFVALGMSSADPRDSDLPFVDAANRSGGALAAEHFLDLRHTRIACVNLALSHSNQVDRMEGFQGALAAAGFPIEERLLLTSPCYDMTNWPARLDRWIEELTADDALPTAIFACDHHMTIDTVEALHRHGIRIPSQISVIGFDDFLTAGLLSPPLTTVRQPVQELGSHAAQRLLRALRHPDDRQAILFGPEILPTSLVYRASTAPPHR